MRNNIFLVDGEMKKKNKFIGYWQISYSIKLEFEGYRRFLKHSAFYSEIRRFLNEREKSGSRLLMRSSSTLQECVLRLQPFF